MAGGEAAAAASEDAGAADAGDACLRALRDTLDALGATCAALAAREVHTFRTTVGEPATAGTRGAFVLQVLRARAASEGASGA
eukprot:5947916-Pleurochrysis_carterae.AAC.1